ncbi:MAG TPA: dockerin type I domain-containing protein [Tepidisphaeraceae bacterium]|nr:dockerin type I domain-containing protein [Tepidisphaeraceae bacterium]
MKFTSRSKGTAALAVLMAAVVGDCFLTSQAQAQYIKSFIADSATAAPSPTSAAGGSWTLSGQNPTTVSTTAGSEGGHNYWEVNDTNTNVNTGNTSNNSIIYSVTNTSDPNLTAAFASAGGWEFTARLKMTAGSTPGTSLSSYTSPMFIDIRNGRRIYTLGFVNDPANGLDGIYQAANGSGFSADSTTLVASLDLSVYHTINMVMVPNASDHTQDVVDVYIDGSTTPSRVLTDANGGASTVTRVQFGGAAAATLSTVYWQEATFQTLPIVEPFGPGDANGDGVVNADDYALIDRGFAGQRVGWSNGDFNSDGLVDANDYLIIDTAYAQLHPMTPDFLASREAEFGEGYVSQLLAAVPEPTSLAVAGLGGVFMMSRRRGV